MKTNIKKILNLAVIIASFAAMSCDSNDSDSSNVTITSVGPSEQYIQDYVTVEGDGLENVQYVFIGNFDSPYRVENGILKFQIPAGVTPGVNPVTLVIDNKTRVTSQVTVLVKPIPKVTILSPSAAAAGENVTIYGENLDKAPKVTVGGVNATVVSSTFSKLVFTVPTVPANTISSTVEVTTTFGKISAESMFYASKNLILNSELELGTGDNFDNWGKWNGGTLMVQTKVASEVYFSRGLKSTGDGRDAWRTQFGSDDVTTTIGKKYLVFMWIKSNVAAKMRFSTNESAGAQYGADIATTTTWKQVSFEFTAKSAKTKIVLDMGATTSTLFVDNITMVAL